MLSTLPELCKVHWTGLPDRNTDQIGKKRTNMSKICLRRALDNVRTFRHLFMILFLGCPTICPLQPELFEDRLRYCEKFIESPCMIPRPNKKQEILTILWRASEVNQGILDNFLQEFQGATRLGATGLRGSEREICL